MKNNEELNSPGSNRRRFVKTLGIAGAAGLAIAGKSKAATTDMDVEIAQFALNLEYLEAEFYSVATTGKTIDQLGVGINGSGNSGATTGGSQVNFNSAGNYTQAVALQIAKNERNHVQFLRQTLVSLGVEPIAKPQINLDALGIGFANQSQFLTLARAFEDTGVTAYAGAIPLIQSNTLLTYAEQILGAECFHSGNIREQIAIYGIPTTPLDSIDILPPPSGTQFFPLDTNALIEMRTPGQVLYIVYGAANVTMGGFFPAGVNGTLNMSSEPA